MKEIKYTKIGDYEFPNLIIDKKETLGRYGIMRQKYLRENTYPKYKVMKFNNTLYDHLHRVEEEANDLYDQLLNDYKKQRNITESLKEKNQLLWIGEMNNIKNCIEEIIINEMIHV
ncbi:hypothetical protein M2475_001944 [Breznakia sp. PF5-3]|uniref:TnpV protein n=1 Tax=unclassified Breznakia TaxID=2623764 RepID=UPI002405E259|nr:MULTISPECIES: TnpV protein [unclassified Breznakia]MDF9825479.1 hypothetical protein [Breznakia sp. PM6-1]MDF9836364.1 hypothetical protein [Breznakia sp. PF5-3]MDF9838930.1 hypothetical protein [Breznakia sp. PFB2-8]MDF9860962.1 hypothetical protein [Breznakia sp. PH5-24]